MLAATTGASTTSSESAVEPDAARRPLQHPHPHPRHEPGGRYLRVDRLGLVLDVHDGAGLIDRELREQRALVRRDLAARHRDRVAVRIEARVTQRRRQEVGLLVARPVLLALRLGVPFLRVETRLVRQVALPEAVDADHAERVAAPLGRQVQPVLVVTHQVEALEPLHEPRGIAARDAERPGQALERRRPLAVLAVPQVLEGVLDLDPIGGDEPAPPTPREARARPEDHDGQCQQDADGDKRRQRVDHGQPGRPNAGPSFPRR